ncbi:MAG: hypothetical protein WCV84_04265 [Patescibacteria group bacterium]
MKLLGASSQVQNQELAGLLEQVAWQYSLHEADHRFQRSHLRAGAEACPCRARLRVVKFGALSGIATALALVSLIAHAWPFLALLSILAGISALAAVLTRRDVHRDRQAKRRSDAEKRKQIASHPLAAVLAGQIAEQQEKRGRLVQDATDRLFAIAEARGLESEEATGDVPLLMPEGGVYRADLAGSTAEEQLSARLAVARQLLHECWAMDYGEIARSESRLEDLDKKLIAYLASLSSSDAVPATEQEIVAGVQGFVGHMYREYTFFCEIFIPVFTKPEQLEADLERVITALSPFVCNPPPVLVSPPVRVDSEVAKAALVPHSDPVPDAGEGLATEEKARLAESGRDWQPRGDEVVHTRFGRNG